MTGGRVERVWSTACIVPSALCRHIACGRRRRGGRRPCRGRSTRTGASPSGPRPTKGVIATPEPRRPIGCGENRLDLSPYQEVHLSLVVPLARYCEHALDHRAVCRFLERHKPEEGTDGGQAQVARSDGGAARRFEISQELPDKGGIQIAQRQG